MKAELQKLNTQLKKLPAREQEAVRLRYGDGLNYKDMAAASGSSTEEIKAILMAALNTLRGHKSKGDKTRYLAFVHGELNEADTQAMAELIEADPGARAEFESILAISDALTDLYDALAEQNTKKKKKKEPASTLDRLKDAAITLKTGKGKAGSRPKLFLAGGFFALAAAIVIYIFVDMQSGNEVAHENPPAADSVELQGEAPPASTISDEEAIAAAKAADAANTPVIGSTPPVDAQTAEQVANEMGANGSTPAEPPPLPAPQPEKSPDKRSAAKGKKLMAVDTAKTVMPKNINKKTGMAFFSKKFDKAPSCIPAKDKKSKSIKAVIGVTKDGTYTQINVLTPSANKATIAKCLKSRLGATAKSLRTTNKSGAKITLVLKVQ